MLKRKTVRGTVPLEIDAVENTNGPAACIAYTAGPGRSGAVGVASMLLPAGHPDPAFAVIEEHRAAVLAHSMSAFALNAARMLTKMAIHEIAEHIEKPAAVTRSRYSKLEVLF